MYYCKHCGAKASSISNLTAATCPRGGKHVLYEGSEKPQHTCKYCGSKASSIANLTAASCPRHPLGSNKGRHEPAL